VNQLVALLLTAALNEHFAVLPGLPGSIKPSRAGLENQRNGANHFVAVDRIDSRLKVQAISKGEPWTQHYP
jgi:hypothetical protein